MNEIIELSADEAEEIVAKESDHYEVVSETYVDHGGSWIRFAVVMKRIADGKFFKFQYRKDDYEEEYDSTAVQVYEKLEMVTKYVDTPPPFSQQHNKAENLQDKRLRQFYSNQDK